VIARERWALGASDHLARSVAFGAKRWWYRASFTVHRVVTNAHVDQRGVLRLAPYPRLLEPPDADPHVRWCGRDRKVTIPIRRRRTFGDGDQVTKDRPVAFLDTNVIVAMFQGKRPASDLLSEKVLRRLRFAVNGIVLQELFHLAEVGRHPELLEKLEGHWEVLPVDAARVSELLQRAQTLRNRAAHSNDLLLASSAEKCDFLVTYDKALAAILQERPLRVVTPEELLEELERLP
jgi:predicted nucleic acid-binding protein